MRTGKRIFWAALAGLGAGAAGMVLGVILEEENHFSEDGVFRLGLGSAIGGAALSFRRTSR